MGESTHLDASPICVARTIAFAQVRNHAVIRNINMDNEDIGKWSHIGKLGIKRKESLVACLKSQGVVMGASIAIQ